MQSNGYRSEPPVDTRVSPLGYSLGNMFDFWFTDITALTNVHVQSTANTMNLTLNITEWQTSGADFQLIVPRVPLPQQFMQALAHAVLTAQTPTANGMLRVNPLEVPSGYAQKLTPNPVLHIEPTDNGTGFLEIDSFLHSAARTAADVPILPSGNVAKDLHSSPANNFAMERRRTRGQVDTDLAMLMYGSPTTGKNVNCGLNGRWLAAENNLFSCFGIAGQLEQFVLHP
jgi:hypothetical protein